MFAFSDKLFKLPSYEECQDNPPPYSQLCTSSLPQTNLIAVPMHETNSVLHTSMQEACGKMPYVSPPITSSVAQNSAPGDHTSQSLLYSQATYTTYDESNGQVINEPSPPYSIDATVTPSELPMHNSHNSLESCAILVNESDLNQNNATMTPCNGEEEIYEEKKT